MKRALYVGQRVHYRFWNEVTVEKWGRGQDNPFISTGTILSLGGGHARVAFEARTDPDALDAYGPKHCEAKESQLPASMIHRGGPEDGPDPALIWRENTWSNQGRNPQAKLRWDYQLTYRFNKTYWNLDQTFRQYLRTKRDRARWDDQQEAVKALHERAKKYGERKRALAYMAEALQTPMVFPPGHPGCDEPIYPTANADGTWFGEDYVCRTHGVVTAAVHQHYYLNQTGTRRTARTAKRKKTELAVDQLSNAELRELQARIEQTIQERNERS